MDEYINREKLEFDFRQCNCRNSKWTPQRVAQMIYRQPAADVAKVRIGRWIHRNGYVECSECGTVGSPEWKCCPICTARMDWEGSKNVKVD